MDGLGTPLSNQSQVFKNNFPVSKWKSSKISEKCWYEFPWSLRSLIGYPSLVTWSILLLKNKKKWSPLRILRTRNNLIGKEKIPLFSPFVRRPKGVSAWKGNDHYRPSSHTHIPSHSERHLHNRRWKRGPRGFPFLYLWLVWCGSHGELVYQTDYVCVGREVNFRSHPSSSCVMSFPYWIGRVREKKSPCHLWTMCLFCTSTCFEYKWRVHGWSALLKK